MEENNVMKEFMEILRNNPDKAFDFICNNYHLFSKGELADVVKELLYGIYYESEHGLLTTADHNKILENTADQLEETYGE